MLEYEGGEKPEVFMEGVLEGYLEVEFAHLKKHLRGISLEQFLGDEPIEDELLEVRILCFHSGYSRQEKEFIYHLLNRYGSLSPERLTKRFIAEGEAFPWAVIKRYKFDNTRDDILKALEERKRLKKE